jgi:CDP-glucose 4,6-dehydratase
VFLTGHTGFKGSWLCRILTNAGAELTGCALSPQTEPNLFSVCGVGNKMTSVIGDIRDREGLLAAFRQARPEIVIHMAAQPIVRDSYEAPAYTYETNVMGTVNILECVRLTEGVKSFLNVTTDKVYHNREWEWGYRETDPLDGFDPYSNSKSCSELVTHSYKDSYFSEGKTAVSTARAGNVIGGGDFSRDRIIPDCVRAVRRGESIAIRNPYSTRPYQHVLEPLFAYLMIARRQYEDGAYAGYYNVGPDDSGCVTTGKLADLFCKSWGGGLSWENRSSEGPFESSFLKLDCSRLKTVFGWQPRWNIETAIEKTVGWTREYLRKGDVCGVMDEQISEFCAKGEA